MNKIVVQNKIDTLADNWTKTRGMLKLRLASFMLGLLTILLPGPVYYALGYTADGKLVGFVVVAVINVVIMAILAIITEILRRGLKPHTRTSLSVQILLFITLGSMVSDLLIYKINGEIPFPLALEARSTPTLYFLFLTFFTYLLSKNTPKGDRSDVKFDD